jgi:uncharacterized membrane protein
MSLLILGLILLLGVHSVRIFADDWRTNTIARIGATPWRLVYSLLALAGLVLLVMGYGQARQAPVMLWMPLTSLHHPAALLMLVAFILIVAGNMPGNAIRAKLGHPMILGVKLWALTHLLVNHTLADVVLFGSLLIWAVLSFRAARRRDRIAGTAPLATQTWRTIATVVVGFVLWAVFLLKGHQALIGVSPLL